MDSRIVFDRVYETVEKLPVIVRDAAARLHVDKPRGVDAGESSRFAASETARARLRDCASLASIVRSA
jgi:hypothetical protein